MDGRAPKLYDAGQEATMIELTEQQIQALGDPQALPRLVNPRTGEAFVLLRLEDYERLREDYDDSPWTREELHALAWEAGERAGWDDSRPS